jgi:acetyl/propionyl-CoA carboxylase alpha subunit
VIRRLLIANRGEIAIRIAAGCRELGIETVAVYSEADAQSAHVAAADRTVPIGPAPAVDSYLSIPALLEAARSSGADAVHPGYGFLSEHAGFARACEEAGLVFVGPSSTVIAAMGSKIEARRRMTDAGVPVVPGAIPADQSDSGIARTVDAIGWPAIVKAAAGGGGKGMRDIDATTDVVAAIQSARRESDSAFGNGTLYVERRLVRPHHVEVQIFGDAHGHVVHLFERECSVQRRHQKVIEETPSPNLTPALRQQITSAAVTAARAVSYRNAGTVEFLVDLEHGGETPPFYFLEMNTRLQVEHGITEAVVGVDLVHAQLLVAAGEPLPWTQPALQQRGHAIEARVYAEDPSDHFLPQAGPLLLYREPKRPGIRVDSGVRQGDRVTVHYDPLLAKVIASAETRPLAIARLIGALKDFPILGIRTNVSFLIALLQSEPFQRGAIDTTLLDREPAAFGRSHAEPPAWLASAVRHIAADVPAVSGSTAPVDPWEALQSWRVAPAEPQRR